MRTLVNILSTYKLSLLISATLSIVVIALRTEKSLINIFFIIFGCFLGTFVMELEYFLQAYWNDPKSAFSTGLKDLVSQKNYDGVIEYIKSQKYSLDRKIVHSVCFQVIAGLVAFFLLATSDNILGIATAVSVFAQSLYQMYEEYNVRSSVDSWFWVLKSRPTRKSQGIYALVLALSFIYILTLI